MSDHAGLSVNGSGTGEKIDTPLTQRGSRPVRYRLIDSDGRAYSFLYDNATDAAAAAKELWGHQEQDETRSGKGWDIEVVD